MKWTADIVTDIERKYPLRIEISEDDACRAIVYRRDRDGVLVLGIYPSTDAAEIPAAWLAEILRSAESDLPGADKIDDGEP